MNSQAKFSCGVEPVDTPVWTDQQRPSYTCPVQTLEALQRTDKKLCSIGMGGKRESKESVLSTGLVDDDDDDDDDE